MTKVLKRRASQFVGLALLLCPCVLGHREDLPGKPAESLYLQLGNVGLDPARVYQVRGASLNRASVQITLDDGTIAFTQDVMGHITGAFFEGDGEILLSPPNEVERRSMTLFTGMAILEERFATAYFRFNDEVASELKPDLRATDNQQQFVDRWDSTARNLANADATRLLMTFSHLLPSRDSAGENKVHPEKEDRFLHARMQGSKLGVFDVFFDSTAAEQIQAGQTKAADNGETYYDVWASFSPLQAGRPAEDGRSLSPEATREHANPIEVQRYIIVTNVLPPRQIRAHARLLCNVRASGFRTLLFELSRFLQVDDVKLDGQSVEFIHNPSIEGTQLSRRGNDLLVVVLPKPTAAGQKVTLEFYYGGEVLAEAGRGLLYVGARGTWYPNRGMEMASFDLQFSYPQEWTLVATGKPTPSDSSSQFAGEQTSRWISDRPIPLAGFNLGKYREAVTRAGPVSVETYATTGVEKDFPTPPIEVVENHATEREPGRSPQIIIPVRPSPSQTEASVGESAARAIQYFAARFGPFPYSHLALTQIPGRESQGWPGLVFLSSFAFLTQQQREELHFEPYRILVQESIPAHETAHQWWGDLVTWSSYRDQWFSEGLANYCALMMLEEKDPAGFRQVMDKYRDDLIDKNKDGISPMDVGPVTLGSRLLSSRFPAGYEAISYGRGTWLFHMLRTMLKDAESETHKASTGPSGEEPFIRALRKLRQRYEGSAISTEQLLSVFAEEVPVSLRYESKNSLDWFLEGWINGTSLPKLELKSVRFTPKGSGTIVSGTIFQKDAPQDLVTSVPIYAQRTGKQPVLLGRVFADGWESSFRLAAPAGIRKILLDPFDTVLTAPK